MLFLRSTTRSMSLARKCIRNVTQTLSSVKNYHPASDKTLLNFSCRKSRLNHILVHSNATVKYYSTSYKDIHTESSTVENVPLNTDTCIYAEHPDVANLSEDEIKKFYELKNISIKGSNVPNPIMKFSELCLPGNLKEVLEEENYSEPTPIQSLGWPVALNCRDMVGVSQTGSGKTLAYMLPAIIHAMNQKSFNRQKNQFSVHSPKVLVLGPTRELVQQIHQVSGRFMKASKLVGACAYGGASKAVQQRHLQGAEICIATPGRLLDFLENRVISLKKCSYLVLDEADRMLDMGFEPQIRDIIEQITCERQTLMWSATWPKEIRSLAEDFLNDYIHVTVGSAELVANPNIQQHIYIMEEDEKVDRLISFVQNVLQNEQGKVLVFAQTKRRVDFLSRLLSKNRIPAWGIHGDCSQHQRDDVLYRFRVTAPSVLIATDVASRGLDISDIQHIVNYDLPTNIEDYIHRIGRTARGSACGEAHSFLTSENAGLLKDLIAVLKESNQPVDPKLFKMLPGHPTPKPAFRPRGMYNRPYSSRKTNMYSYGKNRMYGSETDKVVMY